MRNQRRESSILRPRSDFKVWDLNPGLFVSKACLQLPHMLLPREERGGTGDARSQGNRIPPFGGLFHSLGHMRDCHYSVQWGTVLAPFLTWRRRKQSGNNFKITYSYLQRREACAYLRCLFLILSSRILPLLKVKSVFLLMKNASSFDRLWLPWLIERTRPKSLDRDSSFSLLSLSSSLPKPSHTKC